jgi:hypothetical protein
MYRALLHESLETDELKAQNRLAPDGVKYCNGYCQDFRELEEFTKAMMVCNECRSILRKAEARIGKGEFTAVEFRKNPAIIDGIDVDIITKRLCNTCKEEKPITHFESKKCICKGCRSIQARNRDSDIDNALSDIEKLRLKIDDLRTYVSHIPKGKLIYIISHYQIGRKSTDTKDRMVHNTIEYFKRLLNPETCQNGCGVPSRSEYGMCLSCEKKIQREQLKNRQKVALIC